jgi:ABC-type transporter Mla subunit MlaD
VSKEPTSVPELNLADALQRGIGLRLDRRFAGVHRRIYFALAFLILALTAMGIGLWSELRDLKVDLGRAKAEADAIKEQAAQKARLGRLDEKPNTREAADQTAQFSKLDEKVEKNFAEILRAIQGVADQREQLGKLDEKLDKNLAETARAIRGVAEQRAQLGRLDEKLQKNLAETERAVSGVVEQREQLRKLDEKLDKNLAETARAIQGVAEQKAQLGRLDEKLEKNLVETERVVQEGVIRIESKSPTSTPEQAPAFTAMTLSDGERQIIRKFFGVRMKQDASGFDAKVGEIAPSTAPLYPIPSLLYGDVPKLKDHRFFADEVTGTIILVRPVDNRVVAIV